MGDLKAHVTDSGEDVNVMTSSRQQLPMTEVLVAADIVDVSIDPTADGFGIGSDYSTGKQTTLRYHPNSEQGPVQKKHRGLNIYWKTVETFPSREAALNYVSRARERNECKIRVNTNRCETMHYFKCTFHTVGCKWESRVVVVDGEEEQSKRPCRYMRQESPDFEHQNHPEGDTRPKKRYLPSESEAKQALDDAIKARGTKKPLEIIGYLKTDKNINTTVSGRVTNETRRCRSSANSFKSAITTTASRTNTTATHNTPPAAAVAAAAVAPAVAKGTDETTTTTTSTTLSSMLAPFQPYTVAEMVSASSETLDAAVQSFVDDNF